MAAEDLGRWEPLSVDQVVILFAAFGGRWWLAGGYAIELAVGRVVRDSHGDIDVGVLRRDHLALQAFLEGWDLWVADPPGVLRPWASGESLAGNIHDVWCRPEPSHPWTLQIMIDEADADRWISRRDPRVTRPLETMIDLTPTGVPYLTPAIQLYYKSRHRRSKDDVDFKAVLPLLSGEERGWLVARIKETGEVDHSWLAALALADEARRGECRAALLQRELESMPTTTTGSDDHCK